MTERAVVDIKRGRAGRYRHRSFTITLFCWHMVKRSNIWITHHTRTV